MGTTLGPVRREAAPQATREAVAFVAVRPPGAVAGRRPRARHRYDDLPVPAGSRRAAVAPLRRYQDRATAGTSRRARGRWRRGPARATGAARTPACGANPAGR